MNRATRRQLGTALLFVSPWIVGFLAFNVYPFLSAIYYSLSDFSVLNPPVFLGADNYAEILHDQLFWQSLWNTIIFAALSLPVGMVVALAIALLLNAGVKGQAFFRAVVFVPSLIPLVAMALIWRTMFNGDYGVINYVLEQMPGISEGPNWLGDSRMIKPMLVIMGLWGVGNTVVIYLAGLQDVPRHLYEAAELDGANSLQKLWYVTIPCISPVIYFNLMISCIFVLQVFAVPFVVVGQGGGSGRAGLFYTMYIINQGFQSLRMGYASAMAMILFVLIAGLTYAAHRISSRHIHYGS